MTSLARRSLVAAALAGTTLAGLLTAAPEAHASATGYTTATLTLRAGTTTSTTALLSIPQGAALTLQCQQKGQLVDGTYTTEYWARTTYGGKTGYVSRAYVRVPDGTGLGICSTTPPPPPPSDDTSVFQSSVNGVILREEVIARARNWVSRRVPYSMYKSTTDVTGKYYRTDCSGMVSMALHLDTSLSTVTLPTRVRPISKSELKPGDIVGHLGAGTDGAAGHVMIFNGWTDGSMTSFYTLEETPDYAQAKVRTWGSASYTSYAWRYTKISEINKA